MEFSHDCGEAAGERDNYTGGEQLLLDGASGMRRCSPFFGGWGGFVSFPRMANGFPAEKCGKSRGFDVGKDCRAQMPQFKDAAVEQNQGLLTLFSELAEQGMPAWRETSPAVGHGRSKPMYRCLVGSRADG